MLHCCYTAATLQLHCSYTAATLHLQCSYTAATLQLHYSYTTATLQLHCSYTAVIHCSYMSAIIMLQVWYHLINWLNQTPRGGLDAQRGGAGRPEGGLDAQRGLDAQGGGWTPNRGSLYNDQLRDDIALSSFRTTRWRVNVDAVQHDMRPIPSQYTFTIKPPHRPFTVLSTTPMFTTHSDSIGLHLGLRVSEGVRGCPVRRRPVCQSGPGPVARPGRTDITHCWQTFDRTVTASRYRVR